MREIRTSVDIEAAPTDVWKVLMDFDSYPEWNPFVQSIEGSGDVGDRLVAELTLKGKSPMKITPIVQDNEKNSRFAWLGTMGPAWLFSGHHQFEVEQIDAGTRFHHYEEFSGVLSPLVLAMIRKPTTQGFVGMNRALRVRVEGDA